MPRPRETLGAFSLDFVGFEVTSVTVDGDSASFARRDEELIINPESMLAEGQQFRVGVAYAGSPDQFSRRASR